MSHLVTFALLMFYVWVYLQVCYLTASRDLMAISGSEGITKLIRAWLLVIFWPVLMLTNCVRVLVVAVRYPSDFKVIRWADYDTLHTEMAQALTDISPGHKTARIWGRWEQATSSQGHEGNVWAADVEDIADLMVGVTRRVQS